MNYRITALYLVTLILSGVGVPALAERLQSSGLSCDTLEQVKKVSVLVSGGVPFPAAITQVNREYDTPEATTWVCTFATISYDRGKKVDEFPVPEGTVEVYEAVVLGFWNGNAWVRSEPRVQYLPFMAVVQPSVFKCGTDCA